TEVRTDRAVEVPFGSHGLLGCVIQLRADSGSWAEFHGAAEVAPVWPSRDVLRGSRVGGGRRRPDHRLAAAMTGDTADRIRGTDAHGSTYVRSIVHCGVHAILATWD